MSSHLALKTVWILISWLLQKPADLDLHCLQEKPADQGPYFLQELIYIWFHAVFERINCLSTVRYKGKFKKNVTIQFSYPNALNMEYFYLNLSLKGVF